MLDVVNASLNEVKEVVKKTKCAAGQWVMIPITQKKGWKDTESYSDK